MLRCRPTELYLTLDDIDEALRRTAASRAITAGTTSGGVDRPNASAVTHPRILPGAQRSRDAAITHVKSIAGNASHPLASGRRAEVLSIANEEDCGCSEGDSAPLDTLPGSAADVFSLTERSAVQGQGKVSRSTSLSSPGSDVFPKSQSPTPRLSSPSSTTAHRFSAPPFTLDGACEESSFRLKLSRACSSAHPRASRLLSSKSRSFLRRYSVLRKPSPPTMANHGHPGYGGLPDELQHNHAGYHAPYSTTWAHPAALSNEIPHRRVYDVQRNGHHLGPFNPMQSDLAPGGNQIFGVAEGNGERLQPNNIFHDANHSHAGYRGGSSAVTSQIMPTLTFSPGGLVTPAGSRQCAIAPEFCHPAHAHPSLPFSQPQAVNHTRHAIAPEFCHPAYAPPSLPFSQPNAANYTGHGQCPQPALSLGDIANLGRASDQAFEGNFHAVEGRTSVPAPPLAPQQARDKFNYGAISQARTREMEELQAIHATRFPAPVVGRISAPAPSPAPQQAGDKFNYGPISQARTREIEELQVIHAARLAAPAEYWNGPHSQAYQCLQGVGGLGSSSLAGILALANAQEMGTGPGVMVMGQPCVPSSLNVPTIIIKPPTPGSFRLNLRAAPFVPQGTIGANQTSSHRPNAAPDTVEPCQLNPNAPNTAGPSQLNLSPEDQAREHAKQNPFPRGPACPTFHSFIHKFDHFAREMAYDVEIPEGATITSAWMAEHEAIPIPAWASSSAWADIEAQVARDVELATSIRGATYPHLDRHDVSFGRPAVPSRLADQENSEVAAMAPVQAEVRTLLDHRTTSESASRADNGVVHDTPPPASLFRHLFDH